MRWTEHSYTGGPDLGIHVGRPGVCRTVLGRTVLGRTVLGRTVLGRTVVERTTVVRGAVVVDRSAAGRTRGRRFQQPDRNLDYARPADCAPGTDCAR